MPSSYSFPRIIKVFALLLGLIILSACSASRLHFPGVYKLDIPQGNVITQEMIDQLRPGLTKRQVNFILGTPLIKDTFDQDRWDYLYSYQPGGGERVQERLTIIFDNGELKEFTGDFVQTPGKEQFGQASSTSTSNSTASNVP